MKRLHVHEITSIGAVEAGDNPEADILFWKAKEPEKGHIEKEGSVPDIESLDDAKAYIASLEAKLAAFDVEEPADLPEDLPDVVVKALDEQAATIAKMEAETARISKENEALRDERQTEKYTKLAEGLVVVGPVDEVAPLLKELGDAAPEATDKLVELLAPMQNASAFEKLLKEHGDGAADGGNAVEQITAHAAEIRKNNPDLTAAEARKQAWIEHPDLAVQSREEGN